MRKWISILFILLAATFVWGADEIAAAADNFSSQQILAVGTCNSPGLFGSYYNDTNLTQFVSSRVDAVINFSDADWGSAPPGTGVIADDRYSERWTGHVKIDTQGSWKFYTYTNDGVRLYIDNVLIINKWQANANKEFTATRTLSVGWHTVKLEHYQQDGTVAIKLYFSGPGKAKQIIPSTYLCSEAPVTGIPPTANAGTDQTITLPINSVTLSGSGSDSDGTITGYLWSQVSGPSTATLTNAATATATAGSLIQGTYVFKLTVTDNSGLTGTDNMQVVVNPGNMAPTANAGSDLIIALPQNIATLNGSGADTDGTIAAYAWTQVSGPSTASLAGAASATLTAGDLVQGVYVFRLTVTDDDGATGADDAQVTVNPGNMAPTANAGSDLIIALPQNIATLNGSGADTDGTIAAYAWTQVSGPSTASLTGAASATLTAGDLVQGVYVFRLTVTDDDGATGADDAQVTVNPGNMAPTANAGSDLIIALPQNIATLNGSGADTDGTIAAYAWTQVSGPSTASLTGAASATLTAGDLVQGVYVFRLTVTDDDGATGADDAQVTVNAPVQGQSVASLTLINADTDQDIAALNEGDTINLAIVRNLNVRANTNPSIVGSVQFDYDATVVYSTENSAPYAMAGNNGADYNVWTPTVGSHTIKAIPYTGAGRTGTAGTSLTVHFTVIDQAGNVPPTANAGSDQSITLPTNATVLNGSGSDTDGTVTAYAWTQVSGPSTATLSGAATATLTASALVEGVYVFRLTVTDDDGATGVDDASVSVYAQGSGVLISGELKKWHKVTLTFDGPSTSETTSPNPFMDYRMNVTFTGPNSQQFVVPGYFAVDGNAAETGATSGNKWRVHLAPDQIGTWSYAVSFRTGTNVSISDDPAAGSVVSFDGATGSLQIAASDKAEPDLRAKGRLQYVNKHHLRFAETGEYLLKMGADSPENFLAYEDFDNTPNNGGRLKTWSAHANDWQTGDPSWKSGKGTEIIGAVNYLASEGMNAFSFLTMNIIGDDKNVFPYLSDQAADYTRFDCSKLDQWEIVFAHGDKKGMYLHFKTQETENDQLLDGGDVGTLHRVYYRELIARFSHHLALNWNLGEENSQTDQQRKDMAQYFYDHDPYHHNVVIHTFPGDKSAVYTPLLGANSKLTGASLQSAWNAVANDTKTWVTNSANAGKPWVVANDEQGGANIGVPDDSYTGSPSQADLRKQTVWGNVMAGGAGCEFYFGYSLPHSDLTCQDFRSRNVFWDYARYVLQFLKNNNVPYWDMVNNDAVTSSTSDYALVKAGEVYVVYLPSGGTTNITLPTGDYAVQWFDPRNGGSLQDGTVTTVTGGGSVTIGNAPNNTGLDWTALIKKVGLGKPATEESRKTTTLPAAYYLAQNYPNPFNPQTLIEFSIPDEAFVTLEIYNVRGGLIRRLVNGSVSAGVHSILWDAKDQIGQAVPTGLYVYRMSAGEFLQMRKMTLIK